MEAKKKEKKTKEILNLLKMKFKLFFYNYFLI